MATTTARSWPVATSSYFSFQLIEMPSRNPATGRTVTAVMKDAEGNVVDGLDDLQFTEEAGGSYVTWLPAENGMLHGKRYTMVVTAIGPADKATMRVIAVARHQDL